MTRWRSLISCAAVVCLVCLAPGCRKEKEKQPHKEAATKRVDVRARNACEKAVKGYLDALAAKDYRKAVDSIDVDEMIRQGQEKPVGSAAAAPGDADQLREMLVSMLEKGGQKAGQLSYDILGSKVSKDQATVQVEVYRDGKLSDKAEYALTKRGDNWLLKGTAIRALMPPMKMAPPMKPTE